MTSSINLRAFLKCGAAASLGAALFVGCSGPTPPELASDGAAPSSQGTRQESNHAGEVDAKLPRVVGYLPTYRLGVTPLDFKTLTHLIITFANPNGCDEAVFPDGFDQQITNVVSAAHDPEVKVKVLVALAGGTDRKTKPALERGVRRYIDSVMRLVDAYGFDGVDVDIEGDEIDPATYKPLMEGLAVRLRSYDEPKLLTAAVGSWRSERYRALGTVDFLNVMSYDHCEGSAHECDHSTLALAESDLAAWASLTQPDEHGTPRTIGAENVVLGVPFYGRCWGKTCPGGEPLADGTFATNLTHQHIVDLCANGTFPVCPSSPSDTITDGKGASGYYVSLNSPPTIRDKSLLAKKYGGLMIWELGQDDSKGSLFAEVRSAFEKPVDVKSTSTVEEPAP